MSQMLKQVKAYLRGLARRRQNGVVTADDVQKFLSRKRFRRDSNLRLSVTRSVLNEPNFLSVGEVKSKRPVAKSRRITAWTI